MSARRWRGLLALPAAALLALATTVGVARARPDSCPRAGAAMVRIDHRFCIDTTEVTREQYAAWLATHPSTAGQPKSCEWNTDFTPRCEWPPADKGAHPVVCVDWCDAKAYCHSIGKRLCGRAGGGANAFNDWRAPSSQWMTACQSTGVERDSARCNGWKSGARKALAMTRENRCVGPQGVRDLIGNVWEWEDSCNADQGASDHCRVRGGSFLSADEYLSCAQPGELPRDGSQEDVGFRCCAD
jgi:formylglycine-generating enzyme